MIVPIFSYPRQKTTVLKRLTHAPTQDRSVRQTVELVLDNVAERGDKALIEYTEKFDGVKLTPKKLRISSESLKAAFDAQPAPLKRAMKLAAKRIKDFHKHQLRESWEIKDEAGFRLGQRWAPLGAVGLYVPGGIAAYPSSVLMNAIPAKVAGVKRIVAVTPPPNEGRDNQVILGALHLAGVDEVYQVGGAQSVAALAYGTKTIARVDKVVGPGNRFVAEAKRLLYGTIGIDSIAGPTDVVIIADKDAPIEWIAADMLAQAEHDPVAQSVTILIGRSDAKELAAEVKRQVELAPRKDILKLSLPARGAIVTVDSDEQAIELTNLKAPEHLEIMTKNARRLSKKITNAGSIFLGNYSVEAIGDYVAGPNHVLPTEGTARFFSPLSVQDFLKMTQVIEANKNAVRAVGREAALFADSEGLAAHAESIRTRLRALGEAEK